MLQQFVVTPAAGKRLIGRAMAAHPAVAEALSTGTVVVVAGTTNAYVAEELLQSVGAEAGFDRRGFRRGVVLPPGTRKTDTGRLPDDADFPGDVVIAKGRWQPGMEIFDVVDELGTGDVIIKGANAVNLGRREAGVLVGHPQAGTAALAIAAAAGRRVRLVVPVGLEKRVEEDLCVLASLLNAPEARGPRLLPLPGEVFTELNAVELLSGATAHLAAGGGVGGAEGAAWLAVSGTEEQVAGAAAQIEAVAQEPPCIW